MSTATAIATHRITRLTVRISGKTRTWLIATGNNFDRKNEPRPIPDNFIKISYTCTTTVRNSGMIGRTLKPIGSTVGGAATKPKRIDARCTMIGETYKSTVRRIEMGLLAQ
jgi:hypothetical protein